MSLSLSFDSLSVPVSVSVSAGPNGTATAGIPGSPTPTPLPSLTVTLSLNPLLNVMWAQFLGQIDVIRLRQVHRLLKKLSHDAFAFVFNTGWRPESIYEFRQILSISPSADFSESWLLRSLRLRYQRENHFRLLSMIRCFSFAELDIDFGWPVESESLLDADLDLLFLRCPSITDLTLVRREDRINRHLASLTPRCSLFDTQPPIQLRSVHLGLPIDLSTRIHPGPPIANNTEMNQESKQLCDRANVRNCFEMTYHPWLTALEYDSTPEEDATEMIARLAYLQTLRMADISLGTPAAISFIDAGVALRSLTILELTDCFDADGICINLCPQLRLKRLSLGEQIGVGYEGVSEAGISAFLSVGSASFATLESLVLNPLQSLPLARVYQFAQHLPKLVSLSTFCITDSSESSALTAGFSSFIQAKSLSLISLDLSQNMNHESFPTSFPQLILGISSLTRLAMPGRLDWSFCSGRPPEPLVLRHLPSSPSALTELTLTFCAGDAGDRFDISHLITNFPSFSALHQLTLISHTPSRLHFNLAGVSQAIRSESDAPYQSSIGFPCMPSLQSLVLQGICVDDTGLYELSSFAPQLRSLRLSSSSPLRFPMAAISSVFRGLTALSIRGYSLFHFPEQQPNLVESSLDRYQMLGSLHHLTSLSLDLTFADRFAVRDLAELFDRPSCHFFPSLVFLRIQLSEMEVLHHFRSRSSVIPLLNEWSNAKQRIRSSRPWMNIKCNAISDGVWGLLSFCKSISS